MVVVVSAATAPAARIEIVGPEALLAERASALARLRRLAGCSDAQFAAAYAPLLAAFARYVQRLPAPGERTLLDARLERAIAVLSRRRGAILPPGAEPEQVAREADAWTYALFALALLRGLGEELAPWAVALWAADGRALGRWRPQTEPRGMARVKGAVAYSTLPAGEPPGADWTPLVAGALLPPDGLNWLWREPGVLAVWSRALLPADLPPALAGLFDVPSPFEGAGDARAG